MNTDKNIIHISGSPLTHILASSIGIPQTLAAGFNVLYIDINKFDSTSVSHSVDFENIIKKPESFDALKNLLARYSHQNTVLNIQIAPSRDNTFLLEKLYQLPFKKTFFDIGTLPEPKLKTFLRKIKFMFMPYSLSPDYIFRAGNRSVLPFKKNVPIFALNYHDYDLSLKDKTPPIISSEHRPYCVFLDQFVPGHPDYALLGGITISKEEYYNSVCRFMLKVKQKFGLNIVIALHPKSSVGQLNVPGVIVHKGDSINLVRHSDLVLAHFSTAISFAVIYKKPIIFIINDSMLKTRLGPFFNKMVNNYVGYFGKKLKNCDHDNPENGDMLVNETVYENYLHDYLCREELTGMTNDQMIPIHFEKIFKMISQ